MALMVPPFTMADWHDADKYQRAEIEAVWEINWQSYQSRRLDAIAKQQRDTRPQEREEVA